MFRPEELDEPYNQRAGKTRRILLEHEFDREAFKGRRIKKKPIRDPKEYKLDRDALLVLLAAYLQFDDHTEKTALLNGHLPEKDRKDPGKTFPGIDFDRIIEDTREKGWITTPTVPLQPERIAETVLYWVSTGHLTRRSGREQTEHRSWAFLERGLSLCEALTSTVGEYITHPVKRGQESENNVRWAALVLVGLLSGVTRGKKRVAWNRLEIMRATGLKEGQLEQAEKDLENGFQVENVDKEKATVQGTLIESSGNSDKFVLSPEALQREDDDDLDGIVGDDPTDEHIKGIETSANNIFNTATTAPDIARDLKNGLGGVPVVSEHPGPKRPDLNRSAGGPAIPPSPKPVLDPNKMHGAADGFSGTEDQGGGMHAPAASKSKGNGSGTDVDLDEFLEGMKDEPEPMRPKVVSQVTHPGFVDVVVTVSKEAWDRITQYHRDDGRGKAEESFEKFTVKLMAEAKQHHDDAADRARLKALKEEVARLEAKGIRA